MYTQGSECSDTHSEKIAFSHGEDKRVEVETRKKQPAQVLELHDFHSACEISSLLQSLCVEWALLSPLNVRNGASTRSKDLPKVREQR